MPRWRVDFMGKVLMTLGPVEAEDEKTAIAKAAKMFNIPPAHLATVCRRRSLSCFSCCSCL
jgi:hypothetical protein